LFDDLLTPPFALVAFFLAFFSAGSWWRRRSLSGAATACARRTLSGWGAGSGGTP
jgi:hypothetical protein